MDINYKIVAWDSIQGVATVEARCDAVPQGTRYAISLMKDDGSYYTEEEALSRIEASLPVAWFEQIARAQNAQADDSHIRALAVGPDRKVVMQASDQGRLAKPRGIPVTKVG